MTLFLYGSIVFASFVKIWRVDHSFTLAWYTTGGVTRFEQIGHQRLAGVEVER